MTGRRDGELNAGMPLTPQENDCLANYERYSHKSVKRGDNAELHYVLDSCDEADVLIAGLRAAGPTLTPASFVAGLETIRGMSLRRVPLVSFGPDRHNGGDQQATVQWRGSCMCWNAGSGFDPLFVP